MCTRRHADVQTGLQCDGPGFGLQRRGFCETDGRLGAGPPLQSPERGWAHNASDEMHPFRMAEPVSPRSDGDIRAVRSRAEKSRTRSIAAKQRPRYLSIKYARGFCFIIQTVRGN